MGTIITGYTFNIVEPRNAKPGDHYDLVGQEVTLKIPVNESPQELFVNLARDYALIGPDFEVDLIQKPSSAQNILAKWEPEKLRCYALTIQDGGTDSTYSVSAFKEMLVPFLHQHSLREKVPYLIESFHNSTGLVKLLLDAIPEADLKFRIF